MTAAVTDPTTRVLVPGRIHQRVLDRLREAYAVVQVAGPDPGLLDADTARTVRAIATVRPVDAALIDALPALEIIAGFGVGYDHIDAAHAGRRDVVVTNTPDVLTDEVADTAIGLLLNTVRELPRAEAWLRAGRWAAEGPYPLTRGSLQGRHAGIYGLGRIGRAIARRLDAFGVPVSYHSRTPVDDVPWAYQPSLLALAEAVDTLIAVVPGGPATSRAVNADVLRALGPDGVLVNVGRGTTVDEDALATALADGTIMAAGLDVYVDEPHVPAALLDLPNASLLPHVASASVRTRGAMADLVVDNLLHWFEHGEALTPVPETMHVAPTRVAGQA